MIVGRKGRASTPIRGAKRLQHGPADQGPPRILPSARHVSPDSNPAQLLQGAAESVYVNRLSLAYPELGKDVGTRPRCSTGPTIAAPERRHPLWARQSLIELTRRNRDAAMTRQASAAKRRAKGIEAELRLAHTSPPMLWGETPRATRRRSAAWMVLRSFTPVPCAGSGDDI